MSLSKIGRILYNILPYYVVKKIVLRLSGDAYVVHPKHSAAEYSARGYEIDYGEVLMISDKEQLLKHRARIEEALKRNQQALDDLKQEGA